MKVQRYRCKNKDCDYVHQETIPIMQFFIYRCKSF